VICVDKYGDGFGEFWLIDLSRYIWQFECLNPASLVCEVASLRSEYERISWLDIRFAYLTRGSDVSFSARERDVHGEVMADWSSVAFHIFRIAAAVVWLLG